MSLRLPGQNDLAARGRTGLDVLDYEVVAEMATSLGEAGRKVELAMAALREEAASDAPREAALRAAARAVHAYFIQRELCGLKKHDDAIRHYDIPRAVLARLGAS
jgi:hypothetical protein